ncbi:MAG: glycosyltransferase family 39 protein [Acidobacteria bacterium]|nr:glycosyltransferase family 39 protein [Acidobacteriota bacterium]
MKTNHAVKGTDLAILVLIVVACSIPFLNQPFHMDDNFYMDMARNAQSNLLFPNDTPYIFQGVRWPDLGSHSHPLLQTYFLAAIMCFFGEGPGKEWIYHLPALLYPIIAVLSFYFICARFLDRPLWPSALLACSPLFLVMQHTLMTDMPMLAWWLGAVCCFLYATDLKKTSLYAASAGFQLAAMFTGYQSFALIPLLGFYNLRKRGGRKGWITLILPPTLIGLWFLLNCLHYKRFLWGITLDYFKPHQSFSLETFGIKLFSNLECQGWLIVFPFFILCLLARQLKGRALLLVLLIASVLVQLEVPEYRFVDKCIFVAGLAGGFFIILEMGQISWMAIFRRRSALGFGETEEQFLGLWYFGFLFFCLFVLTEGSARYILPILPPFFICYFRKLEISEISEYRLPTRFLNSAMLASGSLVISLLWGMALSHADLEFARVYPRAAQDILQVAGRMPSYSAGEWGFRYYLGREGTSPLPADESQVRGGSFVAIPKLAAPYDVPANLRSMMMPIKSFQYFPKTPLRILDWQTPAGFYSTGWGLIPFSYSRKNLEEIEVFQVNYMVERLPFAQIDAGSGIKPWPGYLNLEGKSPLAILAKAGTRILYPFSALNPMQLQLLCGISPDSYQEGTNTSFAFKVRQLDGEGNVLAESDMVLQPGTKKEDRPWKQIVLALKPAQHGALEFDYSHAGRESTGTGAFAQSVLTCAY